MNKLNTILDFIGRGLLPVGSVEMYAGAANNVPVGWLICDGQAVSRTLYPKLFETIGTAYGAGNNSTTFNLPDLRGRVAIGVNTSHVLASTGGAESVYITEDEMPPHTHAQQSHRHAAPTLSHGDTKFVLADAQGNVVNDTVNNMSGDSFRIPRQSTNYNGFDSAGYTGYATPAVESTGGGLPHNNMQPYVAMNYIIKCY